MTQLNNKKTLIAVFLVTNFHIIKLEKSCDLEIFILSNCNLDYKFL